MSSDLNLLYLLGGLLLVLLAACACCVCLCRCLRSCCGRRQRGEVLTSRERHVQNIVEGRSGAVSTVYYPPQGPPPTASSQPPPPPITAQYPSRPQQESRLQSQTSEAYMQQPAFNPNL